MPYLSMKDYGESERGSARTFECVARGFNPALSRDISLTLAFMGLGGLERAGASCGVGLVVMAYSDVSWRASQC